MAIDTPAKIAILGAGPIGLEAALYARFLGYQVDVFERGQIADNVTRWAHVRMFSPWNMNTSPLGLAALAAQDPTYQPPPPQSLLTGQEYLARYLHPLAETDLLTESIHAQTTVIQVARDGFDKHEAMGQPVRAESAFRILVVDRGGLDRYVTSDVVIDATGTLAQPGWCGPSGLPALGERQLRDQIEYYIPDVLGAQQTAYADRHTLVVGSGHSAATTVVQLAELSRTYPQTRVTWITRRDQAPPVHLIPDDPLAERQALAQAANQWSQANQEVIRHWPGSVLECICRNEQGGFRVQLIGRHSGPLTVDHVVANIGYRPDSQIHAELQVQLSCTSEGPQALANALPPHRSADRPPPSAQGVQRLRTSEPHFYILGSKSYGRHTPYLLADGQQQIRQLFSLIGGRADLDLYENARKLLP